jgi:hypothetical protein
MGNLKKQSRISSPILGIFEELLALPLGIHGQA